MQIEQVLKSFKNAKLVLGNGFDLFCGVKTKYSDFFESSKGYHETIKQWCKEFTEGKIKYFLNPSITNHNDFQPLIKLDNNITIWDLFFHLISPSDENENINWCDIEKSMLFSLRKDFEKQFRYPIIWENVFNLCKADHRSVYDYSHEEKLCRAFMKIKGIGFNLAEKRKFYEYLLSELKKFENRFGSYILEQTQKSGYKENVKLTLGKLVNKNTSYTVDTFNYSLMKDGRNINGSIKNPIFGIDSSAIMPSDPIYIFTKIYRRLELDSAKHTYDIQTISNNIIIFGHSLNEQDYNYFFPLFNRIKMNTEEFTGRIIFAYYIFDNHKKGEIRSNLILNIAKMFTSYEKYYKNNNDECRLMEILQVGNRILFYEINRTGLIEIVD